jgi:hypothetical protein
MLGGIAVGAASMLWLASYIAGLSPWLGYAWMSRRSVEAGPSRVIIGEDRAGGTMLGATTFPFLRGQTIIVGYDAEIRRGCLWLQVWHLGDQSRNSSISRCVTASGSGKWTVPVEQTGLYAIIIDASPSHNGGPGWDMSYAAKWGATW